jgi:hypothetical protein
MSLLLALVRTVTEQRGRGGGVPWRLEQAYRDQQLADRRQEVERELREVVAETVAGKARRKPVVPAAIEPQPTPELPDRETFASGIMELFAGESPAELRPSAVPAPDAEVMAGAKVSLGIAPIERTYDLEVLLLLAA